MKLNNFRVLSVVFWLLLCGLYASEIRRHEEVERNSQAQNERLRQEIESLMHFIEIEKILASQEVPSEGQMQWRQEDLRLLAEVLNSNAKERRPDSDQSKQAQAERIARMIIMEAEWDDKRQQQDREMLAQIKKEKMDKAKKALAEKAVGK